MKSLNILSVFLLAMCLIFQSCDPLPTPECGADILFSASNSVGVTNDMGLSIQSIPPENCMDDVAIEFACTDANLKFIFEFYDCDDVLIDYSIGTVYYENTAANSSGLNWEMITTGANSTVFENGKMVTVVPIPATVTEYKFLRLKYQSSISQNNACSFNFNDSYLKTNLSYGISVGNPNDGYEVVEEDLIYGDQKMSQNTTLGPELIHITDLECP